MFLGSAAGGVFWGSLLFEDWVAFTTTAFKFAISTVIFIMIMSHVKTGLENLGFSYIATLISTIVLALLYSLWPLIVKILYVIDKPSEALKIIVDHYNFMINTVKIMLPPIDINALLNLLFCILRQHGGNQFEMAEYYPIILIAIALISVIGATISNLFRTVFD